MGIISLIVTAFSIAAILFGGLFGLSRGRNRAVLRLVILIACIAIAIASRSYVVDIIMNLDLSSIGMEGTLQETLQSAFTGNEDTSIPPAMQDLIISLVEIILGLVVFFLLFLVLRLVSLIVYAILKIVVRPGKHKARGTGALVGLIQGALVAFVICAPLTGIANQIDKISTIKINNEQLLEIPEDVGLSEYVNSVPAKIYSSTGGWFFNLVSSGKTSDGKNLSVEDACDVVVAVTGIADSVTQLTEKMQDINPEATPEDQITSMKDIGNSLVEIGNSIDSLSADAKVLVEDMLDSVKEIISSEAGEDLPPEMEEMLDNLSLDTLNLRAVGNAINGLATYVEKTELNTSSEPVTQEDVNNIVNGFAENKFLLDMITSEGDASFIEVGEENAAMFESAIANTTLDATSKDSLRAIFGLSVTE